MTRASFRPGTRLFALTLTLVSLLAWGSWEARNDCHPYRDLSCGKSTDHFSHMNTGRLFMKVGIDIWREPLNAHGRQLTDAERAALPADLRQANPADIGGTFEGWPADKPFTSSWNFNPRFHPPGDMVLTAPVALLYSFTDLSFSDANLLLILLFLGYAHIPIYLLLRGIGGRPRLGPAGLLVGAFVYLTVVHWALEGFYESVAIAPLVLSARALVRDRGLQAIAWFSLAASLHFRALFFAPLALCGLYLVVRGRQWRSWGRRDLGLVGVTAVLALAVLGPFALLWPHLQDIPITTSISPSTDGFSVVGILPFVVTVAVGAAAFVSARPWLDLAVLCWHAGMLLALHEAYYWDMLTLLAWLMAPHAPAVRRIGRVQEARVFVVLAISAFVFHTSLTPEWLAQLHRAAG
jgi:hypothetical protein